MLSFIARLVPWYYLLDVIWLQSCTIVDFMGYYCVALFIDRD